jgi:hypothetical protein
MSVIESRREQIFPILDAAQIEAAKWFTDSAPRTGPVLGLLGG